MSMDILTPVALRGQYLLFDGFSYSLPANKNVPVDLTLRTLRLIAPYNLDEEHYIKDFGSTLYVWKLVRNTQAEVQKIKSRKYWMILEIRDIPLLMTVLDHNGRFYKSRYG